MFTPSDHLFQIMLISWIVLAVIIFTVLLFVSAPYGRHLRKGWGLNLSNRMGWMIMEAPSAILMLVYFFTGGRQNNIVLLTFLILWEIHYLHRTFIFPLRFHSSKRDMPFLVVLMAIFFNTANTYFNGLYLFHFSPDYLVRWLYDWRFIAGSVIFISGFAINQHSDHILFTLRKPGETGYKIPYGGTYRWISCPNYLGEVLEWTGWALATWSLAGVSFAVWTFANLVPRAIANHTWYKHQFPAYPKERKAVIPFVL